MRIGNVFIGGNYPVAIQSMTNTPTADVEETVRQILCLEDAGCEIVRVSAPDTESACAIEAIRSRIHIPLVADIHFDWRLALESIAAGADKIRINPGNIGAPERVREVAKACAAKDIPIRIGVNGGSLEKDLLAKHGDVTPEALVESAERHIAMLHRWDFDNICVSMKSSDVGVTIRANLLFAEKYDYPLHIGVTETGAPRIGLLKTAAGAGSLLALGIGDTIRVSLTDDPTEEVTAARDILRASGRSETGVNLISCPTCARTKYPLIQIVRELEPMLVSIKKKMTVAVMGCVVNGPGEARGADIGVAGGDGCAVLFRRGKILRKIPEDRVIPELMSEIHRIEEEE